MGNETDPPERAPSALTRRLATILSADVAGYSLMMGEDEEATVQTLRGHRAVFDALLKQHHGRVFNTAGDAILAEFPSVVEAVRCATEIQSALHTRNDHLPAGRKMLFRMGINVGDVVVQDDDLLGDGVNVASRIQTVAEPGGICISGSVYDQIQNKLSLQFKPLGAQKFKNIGQPIRTFKITHGEVGALPVRAPRFGRSLAVVGAVSVITVAVLAATGYWLYRENEAKRMEQIALTAELAAAKKASEEARRAAEDQSRRATEAESKGERERLAAESAKRDAVLQAKAQSVEDARRRADAERKQLEEDKRRLEAERQAGSATQSTVAQSSDEVGRPAKAGRKRAAEEKRLAMATGVGGVAMSSPKTQAAGNDAYDGTYAGQVCNVPIDPIKKLCWSAALAVRNGAATGKWRMRLVDKLAYAYVTVAPEGTVKVALDGWKVNDGTPLTGTMNGRLADNKIDVGGRWVNGVHVEGHWTRSQP